MPFRHASLLAVILLTSCMSAAQLPQDARPSAICVYNFLKSARGIEEPTVYSIENRSVVIVYGFKNKSGQDENHEIFINRRPLDGRFIAAGDYPAHPELASVFDKLESRCQVATGYLDEIAITGPDSDPYRWRVDMSKSGN